MSNNRRAKSRSWTEITAAILYTAAEGPVSKTKVMSRGFLSYEQTIRYLSELIEGELLLVMEGKTRYYRTSPKGHQFLRAYEMIQDLAPIGYRIELKGHSINI